jgi:hypothetical protein
MIKQLIYRALLSVFCCYCAYSSFAQCVTSAGTLTPVDQTICKGTASVTISPAANPVLEPLDLLLYVIHDGTATQFGAPLVIVTSGALSTVNLPPGTYAMAAVAGDRILGTTQINYNDPCLDFEHAGYLTVTDLCYYLRGEVVGDLNSDCADSAGDVPLEGITLRLDNLATTETYYVTTQSDGTWGRGVPSGNYLVTVLQPSGVWEPCNQAQAIAANSGDTITVPDFFLKPDQLCPRVEVDLVTPFLRRCFQSTYTLNYCNKGTQTAEGTYIDLELDPFLSFSSASVPAAVLGTNTYRFNVGDVAVGQCGTITVNVVVSCNTIIGQTHCSEATAYPNAPCGDNLGGNWSGASLQVTAECDNGELYFHFENVGTGDMTVPLQYVVIEDVVMMKQVPPPSIPALAIGAMVSDTFPANGSTWRVEAEQEPNHPGYSYPSLSVEGCATGSSFSIGYVNQFPLDDEDYWKDIDCTENQGAYDPNDKQGFPIGYGPQHQIKRGIELEYLIRFQNTGTDTAFTVVIRDELSPWLDLATLRPGASSHPYTFDYYGEGAKMKFIFNDIKLPDSTENLAGSQGFVSYKVKVRPDVPFGTDIENQAAIFFDFNEPIYTNTTRHRVDTNYLLVSSWEPVWRGAELLVSPNPMTDRAVFQLKGLPANVEDVRIEIIDLMGRVVMSRTAINNNNTIQLEREGLIKGSYAVRVLSGTGLVGTAKLLVQ